MTFVLSGLMASPTFAASAWTISVKCFIPSHVLSNRAMSSAKSRSVSPLYKFSQLFAGYLSGGFCQGVFCLEGFCPRWFFSVPPSVRIHLLQQKVKHHFRFHVSYVR